MLCIIYVSIGVRGRVDNEVFRMLNACQKVKMLLVWPKGGPVGAAARWHA